MIWYQVDDCGPNARRWRMEQAEVIALQMLESIDPATDDTIRIYGFDDDPESPSDFWIHAEISRMLPRGRFPTALQTR